MDIPSYACSVGDKIEIRNRTSSKQLATRGLEENQFRPVPAWITLPAGTFEGTIDRKPTREEMPQDINVQLIVEFYSR